MVSVAKIIATASATGAHCVILKGNIHKFYSNATFLLTYKYTMLS